MLEGVSSVQMESTVGKDIPGGFVNQLGVAKLRERRWLRTGGWVSFGGWFCFCKGSLVGYLIAGECKNIMQTKGSRNWMWVVHGMQIV